jgi:hypothetical protein
MAFATQTMVDSGDAGADAGAVVAGDSAASSTAVILARRTADGWPEERVDEWHEPATVTGVWLGLEPSDGALLAYAVERGGESELVFARACR